MKAIPGFPGYFAASEGEIYSNRTGSLKVISQHLHKGYLLANVKTGVGRSTKKKMPVHQLVLFAFHGPKPFDDAESRHLNGVATDNREDNLVWGTRFENAQDAVRHGTASGLRRGGSHNRALISDDDVRTIRQSPDECVETFAVRFGVMASWIGLIRAGKVRTNVAPPRG
jgi:hypothetical protein